MSKKLFCLDCNHIKTFDDNELKVFLDTDNLEKSICRLYGKVICESCKSSNITLSCDKTGVGYFDSRFLKLCDVCNFPISLRRLDVQPYATNCVLCNAEDTEEINSSPPIDQCPDCSSKLFYYNDLSNNVKYINCTNYSHKENAKCNWRIFAYSENDYQKYEKKVVEQLRSLRVRIAVDEDIFLDKVYSDSDISRLKGLAFTKPEILDSEFANNSHIMSYKSLIFNIIHEAEEEYLTVY